MALQTRALTELSAGEVCRVEAVDAGFENAARMAGLGVSIGREVRVVRAGEPMVVQIYGSRIGLARAIASRIRVAPISVEATAQA